MKAMKKSLFLLSFWIILSVFVVDGFSQKKGKKPTKPVKKPEIETTSQQTYSLKVTQIDETTVKNVLKPANKFLLVNFWATWCDPCREEFPDLVKFAEENREKLDFITISLDDLAEIKTSVPKFLTEMKAEKFANYLLKAKDEDSIIRSISGEWLGGMPFTIVYNEKGEPIFNKTGKLKAVDFKKISDNFNPLKTADEVFVVADYVKILNGKRDETLFFYENNWKIYRELALKRGLIHSFELLEFKSETDSDFDLILITRYLNEEQYKNSEKNFEPILKELRPNGVLLKNELKPEEFRKNLFYKVGKVVFSTTK